MIIKIIRTTLIAINVLVFFFYGFAKIIGLQMANHHLLDNHLVKDLPAHTVMWYFFSLNRGYVLFVAMAELVPATLLCFRKTRVLGAILYLTVVVNILALNIFFDVSPWTLIISWFLLFNTVVILVLDHKRLLSLFR